MKEPESNNSMMLLRGTISALQKSRRSHDFVLSKIQHQQIGATAIAASAMGMGATAMSLIAMAGDSEEEADWVEFDLDGKQMEGWLWKMPMRNGDEVEVVAEQMGNDRYVVYSVKRDNDDLIAIYPHATAGRKAHYRRSAKAWMWSFSLSCLVFLAMSVMQRGFGMLLEKSTQISLLLIFSFGALVFGVIALRISRKLMGFVRIAEIVFSTFGWSDIKNIDLRKTSGENSRESQLDGFGNFYFRYK